MECPGPGSVCWRSHRASVWEGVTQTAQIKIAAILCARSNEGVSERVETLAGIFLERRIKGVCGECLWP